jgi:hypothetical protein
MEQTEPQKKEHHMTRMAREKRELEEENAELKKELEVSQSRAIDHVVAPRKIMDPPDPETGLVYGKSDSAELIRPEVRDIDSPEMRKKLDDLAFSKEIIRVYVHPGTDKNAEPFVFVSVNNDKRWLPRGEECNVPRYIAEKLIRSKVSTYLNEEFVNSEGFKDHRQKETTGVRYPISIIEDPNPKGRDWLRGLTGR